MRRFDRFLRASALGRCEVVATDRTCKSALQGCQLAPDLTSFQRFPVAQLSLGKAPCETFSRLPQLAVFLAAFVAHPAADLVFLRLGQLCDRQDIGIALTLDDVLSDPFELLEELLVVWKDHGARCEGDRSKASQAPPRRHPGRARRRRQSPCQNEPFRRVPALLHGLLPTANAIGAGIRLWSEPSSRSTSIVPAAARRQMTEQAIGRPSGNAPPTLPPSDGPMKNPVCQESAMAPR